MIRINQVGFAPTSSKEFIYTGKASTFQVIHQASGDPVYTGDLSDPIHDPASGDNVSRGSFSDFTEAGLYYIKVNHQISPVFAIDQELITDCTDGLLKAFYYQRCGITLSEDFAGPWHHQTCHREPSYLFADESKELDTRGGWHDAGDYGRYTVAAAKAVADLMLAYDCFPSVFDHAINIPESTLKGPDILHEIKYELDFMMTLQREDGAVYTKVTTRYFPGMIMPEEDLDKLLVFDISSPSTGDFAAAMAMASRLYQTFDKAYSQRCLAASKKAYTWLKDHPDPLLFKNPDNMNSGEYSDVSDLDERYWAAAELYRTTGEKAYHKDCLALGKKLEVFFNFGWADVSGYGSIAYLMSPHDKDSDFLSRLEDILQDQVDDYIKRSHQSGYGISLSIDDYIWGSNMVLLNQALLLILAKKHLGLSRVTSLIQSNWDYLYGKNPMDLSYVTGYGHRSVLAPHHRPSAADGVDVPVPGLVSGGPCAGLLDDIAKETCQGHPPAKCFIDHVDSYSTNEITIYWNSPAVFVGAYLVDQAKTDA